MATVGPFNGTNLLLKIEDDGTTPLAVFAHSTSCSLSVSQDTPESTSKSSSGYREVIPGLKSAEISFEGLVAYDQAKNHIYAIDAIRDGQKVDWSLGTSDATDTVYSGDGYISSVEVTGEMESVVTFSGTITVTGSIAKS